MDVFWNDVKVALRTLRSSPGFTVVAVLCLGLGIGASATMFTIVKSVFFRSLPFAEPERIAVVVATNPELGRVRAPVSFPDLVDFRQQLDSFVGLAGISDTDADLVGLEEPVRVSSFRASANFFSVMGVDPVRGRTFQSGEDRVGAEPVVVLGHGAWERRFGSDPSIIGRAIAVGGESMTVIGVMGKDLEFGLFHDVELWLPLSIDASAARRDERNLVVFGRLKPGRSAAQASAELETVAERLADAYPATNSSWNAFASPLEEEMVSREGRLIFAALGIAVGVVLLIACANVANLVMARSRSRRREIAVRLALGSGRLRVVRQLLAEHLAVSLLGAGAGMLLTLWALDVLLALTRSRIPLFLEISADRSVLAFAIILAALTAVAFGLLPAIRSASANLNEVLKEGSSSSVYGGRSPWGKILVGGEAYLAAFLLLGAGLWSRSAYTLSNIELGFDADGVLTCRMELPEWKYTENTQFRPVLENILARVEALPGVRDAALSSHRPIIGGEPEQSFSIEGRPMPDAGELPWAARVIVTPGFFSALGIPLLEGRDFAPSDGSASRVAVVSRMARDRYWGGQSPLGSHLLIDERGTPDPTWVTVVGVVEDIRNPDADQPPEPHLYMPLASNPTRAVALVVSADGDLRSHAGAIREAIAEVDPQLPILDMRTMNEIMYDDLVGVYVLVSLGAYFAALAFALAAAGIYGVVSLFVAHRTREFGLRMALGAQVDDVSKLVIRRGLASSAVGVAFAVGCALFLFRPLSGLLYGVTPNDPVTFVAAPALVILMTVVASLVPALRAARTDPMVALRHE